MNMPVAMAMPAIAAWRFARPDTIATRLYGDFCVISHFQE